MRSILATLVDDQFFRAHLSLNWPIYTSGKIKAANAVATAAVSGSAAPFESR